MQFTQSQHDRQAKARMLGGLIKVHWMRAYGMLGVLEDWAANTGRPGEVPEGRLDGPRAPQMLAALLEHRDAEGLVAALCAIDVLEKTDTGFKATGLEERYGPVFDAAEKRSEAASKAAQKRWEYERAAKAAADESLADARASESHAVRNADAMRIDAERNEREIESSLSEEREQLELSAPEASGDGDRHHPLEALWDNLADPSFARWAKLTSERRRKADARWREHGPGGWQTIIAKVNAAPFLRGKKWMTLDWLLEPKNLQKVIEGNYDDSPPSAPSRDRIGEPPLRNCMVCDLASEGGAIGEGVFCCYRHVADFRANAERNGWEQPWEHAAEWVNAVRAQEAAA